MAKRSRNAAPTPAIVALDRAGSAYELHAYGHDPSSELGFGMEAAHAIGVSPDRVFKTLVASVDGCLVLAVVPVDCTLDLKRLARVAGGKRAEMADPAAARRATGYVPGGISPIGGRQRLRAVVDETARAHPTIFVSAGRRGLDLELDPDTLVALTDATVAPIARRT